MSDKDDLFVVDDPIEEPLHSASDEEPVGNVEDLIPLCVKRECGPQLSTATFGYDIEEMSKRPWSQPGAKKSDYFNYGFDETTWRLYCAMQNEGESSLLEKAKEMLQKLKVAANQTEFPDQADAFDSTQFNQFGGNDYQRNNFRNPDSRASAYKTKMCRSFLEGHCSRGEACNYAHGEQDLRTSNNPADVMRGNFNPSFNYPQPPSNEDYRGMKRYRREGDPY